MNDDDKVIRDENDREQQANLLDEIEELDVIEASELQEGVAFHAFRFRVHNF
jgi:hypothetical protein